jgi:hypothetical protein
MYSRNLKLPVNKSLLRCRRNLHQEALALLGFRLDVRHRQRLLQGRLVREQEPVELLVRGELPGPARVRRQVGVAAGGSVEVALRGSLAVVVLERLVGEADQLDYRFFVRVAIRQRPGDRRLDLLQGVLVVVVDATVR